jgi:hypothetical protein
MKKRLSLVAVLGVMVLILATVLAPGPAVAAGQTFHYSFAGEGADAGWTTCPFEPVPNVVCTDTYISVAEQVYKEDGTKFPSTTLSLYQFSYKFDRKGNYIFVSDSYGFGDATLSVGRQLKSASASATVPITTCTVDRRGNWTCRDNGTVTVSASWTGWGDLVRSNGNYHTVSKGFTYNSHFQGMYRDATASGQVNGSNLGTPWWASIYDSKWSDAHICHGTC